MQRIVTYLNRIILNSLQVLFALSFVSCSTSKFVRLSSSELTQPQEGKMLLIGAIITEGMNPFKKQPLPAEVCITAEIEENGRVLRKLFTVFTDEERYFALENMPQGKYAIVGVRNSSGTSLIWNNMRIPNEQWVSTSSSVLPPFQGDIWPWEPIGKVYNFGYNIWVNTYFDEVEYYNLPVLDGESFGTRRSYTRPRIEEYFIRKYPESGWIQELQQLLPPG